MSTELILAWVAILIAVAGVFVSVWAVFDVRGQVTRLIQLERKRVFTRIRNDMVWQFVDATNLSHSPEIAKGLEEFALLSLELDPAQTPDLTKNAVNNESLKFADELVSNGFATWKPEWDKTKLTQAIQSWQNSINANRLDNMFGKKQRDKSII
jgi:hypothetical protein